MEMDPASNSVKRNTIKKIADNKQKGAGGHQSQNGKPTKPKKKNRDLNREI